MPYTQLHGGICWAEGQEWRTLAYFQSGWSDRILIGEKPRAPSRPLGQPGLPPSSTGVLCLSGVPSPGAAAKRAKSLRRPFRWGNSSPRRNSPGPAPKPERCCERPSWAQLQRGMGSPLLVLLSACTGGPAVDGRTDGKPLPSRHCCRVLT